LIVVEHDEETIMQADHVIDMGPGAGIHGGKIIAHGTPEDIKNNSRSLTGKYLSGKLSIDIPKTRRSPDSFIHLFGCREHNLKNIDVDIPIGVFTLITGVSGSGKSTMIYEILYKELRRQLHNARVIPGKHEYISFDKKIDKVVVIDQSPIGKTPRSNPSTYTKVFDEIRRLFAMTSEAKKRGYKPGRFSFNVKGGRCAACRGDGLIKIEMNFLPDIYIECEECKGKRYNKETLEVTYKNKNIADVLDMSVEEALKFFENIPYIKRKLSWS
jgi:excinuclease ABC subunit A